MVEHNILENIKDPADVTLAPADVARYKVDQMADLDTKAANYVFCKTIRQIVGQKDSVGYLFIARGPAKESSQHSQPKLIV